MPKAIVTRTALADQVARVLEERILDGVYQPETRLNIDALAREFTVSSSPVREALSRLTAAGLVATTSFTGFTVAPLPTRAWFEELLEFRVLAEGYAVARLAQSPKTDIVARMIDSFAALKATTLGRRARDFLRASRADQDFHEAMLEGGGNAVMAQSVRALHPHLQHARLFRDVPQDITPVIAEHGAILDAVQAADPAAARNAVEAHLRASWARYDGWRDVAALPTTVAVARG